MSQHADGVLSRLFGGAQGQQFLQPTQSAQVQQQAVEAALQHNQNQQEVEHQKLEDAQTTQQVKQATQKLQQLQQQEQVLAQRQQQLQQTGGHYGAQHDRRKGGPQYGVYKPEARAGVARSQAALAEWRARLAQYNNENPGTTLKQAMKALSEGKTANRIQAKYKAFDPATVNCNKKVAPGYWESRGFAQGMCPAKMRPARGPTLLNSRGRRPGSRSHRPLSVKAAVRALREFHRAAGNAPGGSLKSETRKLRSDISRKRAAKFTVGGVACETSVGKDGRVRIASRAAQLAAGKVGCADSWLYRKNPSKYDYDGMDNFEGDGRKRKIKGSAYGVKRLSKRRKDFGTSRTLSQLPFYPSA